METYISATEAKNNLGRILKEAHSSRKPIIITRHKKPIAKIVPVYSPARMTSTLKLSDSECKKLEKGIKEFKSTFKFSF